MKLILLIFLSLLVFTAQPRRRRMGATKYNSRGASTLGKGIASLVNELKNGGDDQDEKMVSGKNVEEQFNVLKMHQQMQSSLTDTIIYIIISIIVIIGINYCIYNKMQNKEETQNMDRIREQHLDRNKNYAILKAIAEHGVHPDRASGKIYKIKL